jgi:beta-N-acetylhexosaminidase
MSLDEKLGQMMMVQFVGQSYSTDLSTMINQYHVGSVLYFQFNIGSKSQLSGLNSQMQHDASLPLLIAVDQEGGTVDRLINLDGAQPSASQIGASGNPKKAYQQGVKDAKNLAAYGFNLNLAPVVDVNNVYNWQLQGRTYGSTPTTVSEFAEQYLTGLQQSGKVLGTLKHFPGLGDVSTDPHYGLPALTRSLSNLNAIDWAPYRTLINQGHVYSIMVTHEIVDAVDKTQPSSLSPKVIGILRNQLHFQGVIITDSLTMDSIHNFYTYGEAAAKAVEAGDDILMGADSPSTLAQMITGIKQAMSSGAITQQQIDASVSRILLFKYEMGLLHL